jgi:hypothetical protein
LTIEIKNQRIGNQADSIPLALDKFSIDESAGISLDNSNIEFNVDFLKEFLSQLVTFNAIDNECEKLALKTEDNLEQRGTKYFGDLEALSEQSRERIRDAVKKKSAAYDKYETALRDLSQQEVHRQNGIYEKINNCKNAIWNIDLTQNIDDGVDNKGAENKRKVLLDEIEQLRVALFAEEKNIQQKRDNIYRDYQNACVEITRNVEIDQKNYVEENKDTRIKYSSDCKKLISDTKNTIYECIRVQTQKISEIFSPDVIDAKYNKVYSAEPCIEKYQCCASDKNPASIRIATLTYNLGSLKLGKYTKEMLEKCYPTFCRHGKLHVPFCITFDERFNYLFELNKTNRKIFIDKIRALIMRIFLMIPPNKVNFTFIDPITLGETFALFTRLVEVNDHTSKVINGKIWTSTADIEERLRVLTDHIANVTQRCLQGQYDSIQAYNRVAGQNAEPYQILVVMDFPSGFKEDSLRMLEQIMTTGPKCGVYTIILRSDEQIVDKKIEPLINNIVAKTLWFVTTDDNIILGDHSFNKIKFLVNMQSLMLAEELDKVIPILKEGIKNADKIVIDFHKSILPILPKKDNWCTEDCSTELVIPIGIHGANNIQNLAFGERFGSYHALIGGQIGSGKSSLLHTIIMSALLKYSADQLHIFLVDFKRGVEFKIYTNHKFDVFRTVAIESEREFGSSVLEFLDKEMSLRADKFKQVDLDSKQIKGSNVQEYRKKTGKVLPRVLLIIDEFHVLFTKDNDIINKKASAHLEQIIKQGRAFGIHVILATQSMIGIGAINQGVLGQIGTRIALKCPKTDAHLILGSNNDAVDLLSPTDPGQAVYNSDCGNITANTIFRVSYIEERHTELLTEISEQAKKITPKQSIPETQVMISNIEDNIYNPFQKFFSSGEEKRFAEKTVLIGEPLQLFNTMRMVFRTDRQSNMLIIGNDGQKARTMFTFCALSLVMHQLSKNGHKKPTKPIHIIDYAPIDDPLEKDILGELANELAEYIEYTTFEEIDKTSDKKKATLILENMYNKFLSAEKNKAPLENSEYLLIFGLQRARNLRNNEIYQSKDYEGDKLFDDFDTGTKQEPLVAPFKMFQSILNNGASNNIHSIIWENDFKLFNLYYSRMLENFDLRIGFTMPDDDSLMFLEEANGSQISENNAIYNYCGKNQKFRPYKKPDLNWLKTICVHIKEWRV